MKRRATPEFCESYKFSNAKLTVSSSYNTPLTNDRYWPEAAIDQRLNCKWLNIWSTRSGRSFMANISRLN